jgi:hypothetical protein
MINPHIIVDPVTNRCLCGIHGIVGPDDHSISCGDILAAMDRLIAKNPSDFDALMVKQTIMSVVKDRA